MIELSVIIPVFNEHDNVVPLHESLTRVLNELGKTYEVIYVDDGSIDGSFEELRAMAVKDSNLKILKLRRNYGQTAAISAGSTRTPRILT